MPLTLFQPQLVELQKRIHQATRDAPRPLRNLVNWVLEPRNLEAAWRRVSTNDGALTPGADGVTCRDIAPRWRSWLADLARELRTETYRPASPRWVDVPKHSDPTRTRRLGILTIRDRVVHAALKQVLEPVLEPTFAATSFGFRPGRSVPAALAAAVRAASPNGSRPSPYRVAVHVDVAECFDSLDHRLLLDQLGRHVADPHLLRLVGRLLRAGGRSVGWFWPRRRGVVQGSSLSPLLCNLYLHATDQMLLDLAHATDHAVLAPRYADDLLILARDAATLRRALRAVRRMLKAWRVRLRNPREHPRRLADGITWLGVVIRPQRAGPPGQVAFGYEIPAEKVAALHETVAELTARGRVSPRRASGLGETGPHGGIATVAGWLEDLNDKLRQWREAYALADNAAEVFRALDARAREHVGRLLAHATGLSPDQVRRRFRRATSANSWTWQVDGTALLQLTLRNDETTTGHLRRVFWELGSSLAMQRCVFSGMAGQMNVGRKERWRDKSPGLAGSFIRPDLAIPCRVARQQSPTPFRQTKPSVAGPRNRGIREDGKTTELQHQDRDRLPGVEKKAFCCQLKGPGTLERSRPHWSRTP